MWYKNENNSKVSEAGIVNVIQKWSRMTTVMPENKTTPKHQKPECICALVLGYPYFQMWKSTKHCRFILKTDIKVKYLNNEQSYIPGRNYAQYHGNLCVGRTLWKFTIRWNSPFPMIWLDYFTPGIYAAGYIVFALTFVRSYVRSFVCSFVTFRHVRRIYIKVFG